jgi:ADP-ribose pyrophosphatase YjhB (NUDIX family)
MKEVSIRVTLTLLIRDFKELLLGFKLLKIGAECWNAPGGNIEGVESPEDAALRELLEELKVKGKRESMVYVGNITFHNQFRDKLVHVEMFTYILTEWEGEPQETKEMVRPTWFSFDEIPYQEMLEADRDWLPRLLKGEKIKAEYWYEPGETEKGPKQFKLVRSLVREIDHLEE